jgi:hypothetical protein
LDAAVAEEEALAAAVVCHVHPVDIRAAVVCHVHPVASRDPQGHQWEAHRHSIAPVVEHRPVPRAQRPDQAWALEAEQDLRFNLVIGREQEPESQAAPGLAIVHPRCLQPVPGLVLELDPVHRPGQVQESPVDQPQACRGLETVTPDLGFLTAEQDCRIARQIAPRHLKTAEAVSTIA